MDIAPGEPVPPGLEHEVKPVAEIQDKIDQNKSESFVGLEYLAELNRGDDKRPAYVCVLCEKHGDPRTIMHHMFSYMHRLKYLVIVTFHTHTHTQIHSHIIAPFGWPGNLYCMQSAAN